MYLLQEKLGRARLVVEDSGPDAEDHEEKAILCRRCHWSLAKSEWILSIENKTNHIFTNPSGIIFSITTFRESQVFVEQPPTDAFSWFVGYGWQIACCQGCAEHVGWKFLSVGTGGEPPFFYGLIDDRLIFPSS